jgi:hypothetical protein
MNELFVLKLAALMGFFLSPTWFRAAIAFVFLLGLHWFGK